MSQVIKPVSSQTIEEYLAGDPPRKIGWVVFCPGCGGRHVLYNKESGGPNSWWSFDGNMEKPTFEPSLLITHEYDDCSKLEESDWGPWVPHPTVAGAKSKDPKPEARHKIVHVKKICHSFIRKGQWQFLHDSTHKLAGQTVDLPPLNSA